MDGATISILIAALGVVVAIASFYIGQKKSNTDDGRKLGEFMGEIRADIRHIKDDIRTIREDRNNIINDISMAIKQHEKIFHGKEKP
jgi:hypothetical protein